MVRKNSGRHQPDGRRALAPFGTRQALGGSAEHAGLPDTRRRRRPMAESLPFATWFWLLVPMLGCLLLSVLSLLRR